MRINVNGELGPKVTSKDVILYIISQISASGGTGHFIEFAGNVFREMSMEARMTVCNMSIECGARGGIIAPDRTTFDYLRGRENVPKDFDAAVAKWSELYTDEGAGFDAEHSFRAEDIPVMITYGTNPGLGMAIDGNIPAPKSQSDIKALEYMAFDAGQSLVDHPVDYIFMGSCTNGRIEDFRLFTEAVKGKKKADNVIAWLVPGSHEVEELIEKEGLKKILEDAGFELRQPGCSACLAMNPDKIPAGKYSVSTSNRNFEGRQGPGARTLLASPLVAAMAAINGKIVKP
jgi:3-isopropylmalate/(R)-2-methylmalate dehydratase large subunit